MQAQSLLILPAGALHTTTTNNSSLQTPPHQQQPIRLSPTAPQQSILLAPMPHQQPIRLSALPQRSILVSAARQQQPIRLSSTPPHSAAQPMSPNTCQQQQLSASPIVRYTQPSQQSLLRLSAPPRVTRHAALQGDLPLVAPSIRTSTPQDYHKSTALPQQVKLESSPSTDVKPITIVPASSSAGNVANVPIGTETRNDSPQMSLLQQQTSSSHALFTSLPENTIKTEENIDEKTGVKIEENAAIKAEDRSSDTKPPPSMHSPSDVGLSHLVRHDPFLDPQSQHVMIHSELLTGPATTSQPSGDVTDRITTQLDVLPGSSVMSSEEKLHALDVHDAGGIFDPLSVTIDHAYPTTSDTSPVFSPASTSSQGNVDTPFGRVFTGKMTSTRKRRSLSSSTTESETGGGKKKVRTFCHRLKIMLFSPVIVLLHPLILIASCVCRRLAERSPVSAVPTAIKVNRVPGGAVTPRAASSRAQRNSRNSPVRRVWCCKKYHRLLKLTVQ